MKVLVCAATKYGATSEIAQAVAGMLAERGLEVTVVPPNQASAIDAAFQRDCRMTIDEGVALAVQDRLPPEPASAARPQPHTTLASRQMDIARRGSGW
jgi:hypothetical protein